MDSPTESTGYVASNRQGANPHRYHTDPDCPYLKRVPTVHEYSISSLQKVMEECRVCREGPTTDIGPDRGAYRALREAAEEVSDAQ